MSFRVACLAALLLAGTLANAQQPAAVVRDAGPGLVGRYLDSLLRAPGTGVAVSDTVRIARGVTHPGSIVVIGKRAEISGTVQGDVVVVGGDLFMKPGGRIEGKGVAIGGGAYPSLLGKVSGGLTSHRDFTFDARSAGAGIELWYRSNYVGARRSPFVIPLLYGLRPPAYDRSNGVSLPLGRELTVGDATIDLVAVYRSQLGRVDPYAEARVSAGRKHWIEASAGRETRSNEDWISGPFSNSLNSLISGRDERNWYRATGGRATLNRLFETTTMIATYALGASFERAVTVRPGLGTVGGPWSLFGRKDSESGMLRPNPQIPGGDITSIIAEASHTWTAGPVQAGLEMDLEAPVSVSSGERFIQVTTDGRVDFPTFGLQRYRLELHALTTLGDAPPQQRFGYIGGSGTLPTQDTLLTMGGDQLLFVENRYEIPMPRIQLPLAGSPTIAFRHILGSAGLGELPDFTQIVGVRVSIPFLRVEWLIETGNQKTKLNAGVSFSR